MRLLIKAVCTDNWKASESAQETLKLKTLEMIGGGGFCPYFSAGTAGNTVHKKLSQLIEVKETHAHMLRSGKEVQLSEKNTLMDMYMKCGSLANACHVFENTISGHVQKEESALALELYARMQQEGVIPSDRTFVVALKACSGLAALEERKVIDSKVLNTKYLEKGRVIHSQAVKSAFESDVFVGTALVYMYAKCGSMDDARHVFEELPYRDVVSWNVMIAGYAEQDDSDEALKLHAQIQEQGLSVDSVTFAGILKACGNTAALEPGKKIHTQICRVGFKTTAIVANTLMDMGAKCGSMLMPSSCLMGGLQGIL